MNIIIGNQRVALHGDSTLSLERLSPALNEKVGSFSYPFSVPTSPNQKILGWPGVLERTGELTSKTFIVEDQGMQVLRGEVEYDTVTKEDIGIILTSGLTEFYAILDQMKDDGSTLADLNLGSEVWFSDQPTSWDLFQEKLTSWDSQNRAIKAPFSVAPFQFYAPNGTVILSNKHNALGYLTQPYPDMGTGFLYMIQFKAWYILERIFTLLGYTIVTNQLKEGPWEGLTILTRPFLVTIVGIDPEMNPEADPDAILVHPPLDNLHYQHLMPEVSSFDFIEEIRTLMGLAYDIDDLKKEVKILQLKNILAPSEAVTELPELSGWQHKEGKPTSTDGYSISFMTQDDPLDNRGDYTLNDTFETNAQAPALPPSEGYIIGITSTGRDFIAVKNSSNVLVWARIGRLKTVASGLEKTKIEFGVKVAAANIDGSTLFQGPKLSLQFSYSDHGMVMYDMPDLYLSLYRGMTTNFVITEIPYQTVPIPFLCSDKWNYNETIYLSPQCLFDSVYLEYLVWKASASRSFTKMVKLSLPQLLSLQWDARYVISGVKVILSRINYDLPFTGIVRLEGYVG